MRAETRAALAAADAALKLMMRRAGAAQIPSKGARDLVTATDVACEDAVRASLLAEFPEWTVVGEERGGEDQIGDRPYWLVDPICGTRNFAANIPLYAVDIARPGRPGHRVGGLGRRPGEPPPRPRRAGGPPERPA